MTVQFFSLKPSSLSQGWACWAVSISCLTSVGIEKYFHISFYRLCVKHFEALSRHLSLSFSPLAPRFALYPVASTYLSLSSQELITETFSIPIQKKNLCDKRVGELKGSMSAKVAAGDLQHR